MGIGDLGGWLRKALEGSYISNNPILNPPQEQPKPQTVSYRDAINPDMQLPSYTPGTNEVFNLPEGTSTFAPRGPLVLKNPGYGPRRFDPTGTFNDDNLPSNPNMFLMMPMQQPEFKQMPYLKKIGGGY